MGRRPIRDGKESRVDALPSHDRGDTLYLDPSIRPDRIETIRRIFDLYLHSAISPNRIASMLNEEQVSPITGKDWTDARIRQLLANPVYIGQPASGKRSNAKFYETLPDGTLVDAPRQGAYKTIQGRRQDRDRWRQPPTPIFDPIVGPETFAKVNAKLAESPRRAKAPRNDALYYAGLLVCDRCGQTMAGAMFKSTKPSYICSTKNKYGDGPLNTKGCRFHRVQPHELDPLVERYMEATGNDLNEILRSRGDRGALDSLLAQEEGVNAGVDHLVSRMEKFIRAQARADGVEATEDEMDLFDSNFAVATLEGWEDRNKEAMVAQGMSPELIDRLNDEMFPQMLRLANASNLRRTYEGARLDRLETVRRRKAELEADYDRQYNLFSTLKPGSRTAERAQADLERLEAEIDSATAELEPLQESFDTLLDELAGLRERIAEARLVFAKGTDRMKAEALRGFIREIRCIFVPRAATRSDLVSIEIVPQIGDRSRIKVTSRRNPTDQATPAPGTSTSATMFGA